MGWEKQYRKRQKFERRDSEDEIEQIVSNDSLNLKFFKNAKRLTEIMQGKKKKKKENDEEEDEEEDNS